ncbi:MAG: PEP-CTERM sorting domain-containing protein [Pseudomonadota bacterium]
MFRRKNLVASAAATLALSAAITAHATVIDVEFQGFESGSRVGRVFGPDGNGVQRRVAAGQFNFDVINDPDNNFADSQMLAFCIDITNWLVTNRPVSYDFNAAGSTGYLDGQQLANISWLYDSYASALGSATFDAAFQLALWEIMYDGDAGFSLINGANAGSLWSTGFGGARTIAEGWLGALTLASPIAGYTSSSYNLYVLTPDYPTTNQTLIVASPVSEPAIIALFGLGLIALGVSGRRQRDT